ncbi:MAG: hypothetical protein K2L10_00105 [Ruminococcus sp.]|nr:hypothetical protein [Ruminococcus sp.]
MLPFIPKELMKKIDFIPGSVKIKDDVTLTEEEQKIFEKFKEEIEYSDKHRYD